MRKVGISERLIRETEEINRRSLRHEKKQLLKPWLIISVAALAGGTGIVYIIRFILVLVSGE
ncbi:hypothetical protein LCGC14_2241890 [marine sediment metagenome]|uniref:Death domain-containing protein n=1 Tax=marine sediment metagenome TaxID=412755 RepID=A0A0F9D5E4_9ZZZZ